MGIVVDGGMAQDNASRSEAESRRGATGRQSRGSSPEHVRASGHAERTTGVPLAWSWRLSEATPEQRNHFEIMGSGQGVHWPDLDEDI